MPLVPSAGFEHIHITGPLKPGVMGGIVNDFYLSAKHGLIHGRGWQKGRYLSGTPCTKAAMQSRAGEGGEGEVMGG